MKLLSTIIVLQLTATAAFANSKVTCLDPRLQDAQMVVVFNADEASQTITATLGLPTGKSSAESYQGNCDVNFGESEWDISLSCKVATPNESYSIALIEDPELTALVASDANKLPPYRIPCTVEE